MRGFEDYDAVGLAELVRTGRASPVELVDACIATVDRLNPAINAVIHERFDAARAEAAGELPDGPLRGVPFLIKDIGANQAGLPYCAGNQALKDAGHRSDADTELGARFRRAGLLTVGKTNTPELGSVPTTQPTAFGATNNPWDLSRSPSGSSGGSAAAVAAGMLPMAHANDGGGSIRLPASWCGLVGLKTTRGRVPGPASISRLTAELCVSRTVRDTAALLDAVQGHVAADLYQLPAPSGPYLDELGRDPGRLRIGLLTDGGSVDIDPACINATTRAAALLESMGHDIVGASSDVLFGGSVDVNSVLWVAGLTRRVDSISDTIGRQVTAEEVEPYNWSAAERGRATTASEWSKAQEDQQAWSVQVLDWFEQFDLLLTPTSGCPPLPTDELWPDPERPWRMGRTYGRIGRFTLAFNVTGQPAISLPLYETANGLPIGVHLVAKMGREDILLRLAAQLEQALPWAPRYTRLNSAMG